MKIKILFFLILLFGVFCFASKTFASVIFQSNFDSITSPWSPTQVNIGSTQQSTNCPSGICACQGSSCGYGNGTENLPSSNWIGIYNGPSYCDGGTHLGGTTNSGGPGNNTLNIASTAGYGSVHGPGVAGSCYNGSGHNCLTFWDEVCEYNSGDSEDSDGNLSVDLGSYYPEVYISWKVKFQPNYQWNNNDTPNEAMHKFFHLQWWDGNISDNIYDYHTSNGSTGKTDPFITGILQNYAGGNAASLGFTVQCDDGTDDSCGGSPAWNPDQPGEYPTDYSVIGKFNNNSSEAGTIPNLYNSGQLFDGNWHTLTLHAKINSTANAAQGTTQVADGVFEFWVDGTQVYTSTNHQSGTGLYHYYWSSSGSTNHGIPYVQTGGHPMAGFRVFSIGGNNGNRWTTQGSCTGTGCEQWYSVDNLVIGTTLADVTGSSDTTIPSAPTGLSVN